MQISYLDGIRLRQVAIAGARRVILMQDKLNKINVFPVPDNDTGTNMALTMQSIAEGAISCRDQTLSGMSQCLADSALMGARGNSGAILAQFFQGMAEHFKGKIKASPVQFGDAALQARNSSYEAISEPREGTILTVIHDWSEHIKDHSRQTSDFVHLLKSSLDAARSSLKNTPKKLKLLAKAGVVDAGAQGFVHMLEGIHQFLHSGKVEKAVGIGGKKTSRANVETAPEDIEFQFCTECFVQGKDINKKQLRDDLSPLGNSLIVAGSSERVRVHIHTNEPKSIFEIIEKYGAISKQKYDDMRQQHTQAYTNGVVKDIALITDSACDLPAEFMLKHNIQMVPVQLSFGSDNYIDKITITPKEFYRLLKESAEYPKTSQPSPGDFVNTYKETLEHYPTAVAIHLSGTLSGTFQAAKTAAKTFRQEKLQLIDSRNVCVGLGLVVAEAAKAIESGAPAKEVIRRAQWAADNVQFFVYFDTVEYLIQGGRLNKYRGLLAEKLHLKPILTVNKSGQAEIISKTVGGKSALNRIIRLVRKNASGKKKLRFAVAHSNAPDRAEWLSGQLEKEFDTNNIMIVDVSPALGAHAGPGAAGVAFLGE